MRASWLRAWTGIGAVGLAALAMGACSLVAGLGDIHLSGLGGSGGSVVAACHTDADCDDVDPCTQDSCGTDHECVNAPLDGVPGPSDDRDCTVDTCVAGKAAHAAKAAGTGCVTADLTAGTCQGSDCIEVTCSPTNPCPNVTACASVACDGATGQCVLSPLPDGTPTPGFAQVPGDCRQHVCIGGVDSNEIDDADLPKTATDCDEEVCTSGVPSNPSRASGTPCSTFGGSQPGFCDASGACRQCSSDADCGGTTSDCQRPACDLGTFTCTATHTAADTATTASPPQSAGDCTKIVCDGNGGTKTTADATDPANDGNPCTTDACGASGTTHTPVADGAACGANGALTCTGGVCVGCATSSDCGPASCAGNVAVFAQTCSAGSCASASPATQDCTPYLCAGGACPTTCDTDADCTGGAYCTGTAGSCVAKKALGQACTGDKACQSGHCVDAVCCSSACTGTCLACSAAKKGGGESGTCGAIAAGSDPDAECADQGASSCGLDGTCNGSGACRTYATGSSCSAGSCAGSTLTRPHTCTGGACAAPSPSTVDCAPFACTASGCKTSCAGSSDCTTGYHCKSSACLPVLATGAACTASSDCQGGHCVDGVCCSTACDTACSACSAAKKASGTGDGTCGPAKDDAPDPRGICATSSPSSCGTDGTCAAGACAQYPTGTACQAASCIGSQLVAAKTCSGSGACSVGGASSACPGSFLCNKTNTACLSACGAANGSGDASCVSTAYCDGVGAGACQAKKAAGASCGRAAECLSGTCPGGTCN
jgi:hypothetical protein